MMRTVEPRALREKASETEETIDDLARHNQSSNLHRGGLASQEEWKGYGDVMEDKKGKIFRLGFQNFGGLLGHRADQIGLTKATLMCLG